jgi:hypothetical protein
MRNDLNLTFEEANTSKYKTTKTYRFISITYRVSYINFVAEISYGNTGSIVDG